MIDDRFQDLLADGDEVRETHISHVILRSDEVYKLKKPVCLGFLDFSSLEKRHRACEAEVRLNRRLAPDVYLGCVAVTRGPDGRRRFGGDGEIVDWAVHMKRMPDEKRADLLLLAGQLGKHDLEQVAARLVAFHAQARCDSETSAYGSVETVRTNVRENFDQTRGTLASYLTARQAREIETWQLDFLRSRGDLFETRSRAGRVRDGHGDLRLEHVYLDGSGGIVVLDCIEFNRRFRFADVCADIAFLAMDLAWHERPGLAEYFVAAYARSADDYDLYPLIDFYESYRAFVRGKVASIMASDPKVSTANRQRAARQARRYFVLALASERRALVPPRVFAVGGIIATGKSTVADALAGELCAPVVATDRTRKSLLGVPPTQKVYEAVWAGAYSRQQTERVYAELWRRADAVLSSGRTVVIDASFRSRELRAAAVELARRHGAPFLFIECQAPLSVCRDRLRERAKRDSVSDGRLEIFDDFVAGWQPANELPETQYLPLATTQPIEAVLESVLDRLQLEKRPARSSYTPE